MPSQLRVPGHTLRYEGAPFGDDGRIQHGRMGKAKCSCGEMSPVLISNGQRQAWHREHKMKVLSEEG